MYMLARNKMQKICVFAFMTVVCSGSPPLLEAQESSPHFFTTREMQRKDADDSYYTYDSQEKISLAKILHIASSPDEEQAPVVILPTLVIVQETGFMHVLLVLLRANMYMGIFSRRAFLNEKRVYSRHSRW